MAQLYGVQPDYLAVRQKPFIKDYRYISLKGGKRRRLAKHLKSREYYLVGYPRLTTVFGQPRYEIWTANGGKTFQEACLFLNYKLEMFRLQVEYYNETKQVRTD